MNEIENDMTVSETHASDICSTLGRVFLKLFHAVYNRNIDESSEPGLVEMASHLATVRGLVLETTAKHLSNEQIDDWFFAAGVLPENVIKASSAELHDYAEFCSLLDEGKSLKSAFESIGVII